MRKIITMLSILAILAAATMAHAADPTPFSIYEASGLYKAIDSGKLVVGMEVEYWPFEFADKSGKPTGFDVDIASLAAKELGVKLVIKDIEWTGLIPALTSGKVDMIISGMTATLTRAKTVTFTQPYFITGLCALVSNKKATDVTDYDQLNQKGRILAVKTGTTAALVAPKKYPKAEIKQFKDETACVREVVTGRADAFFYDQISINKHQKQNQESTHAILTPFTYEPLAIAINKGDFDFWQWLNQFLITIRYDGRYEELYNKYFKDLPQAQDQ